LVAGSLLALGSVEPVRGAEPARGMPRPAGAKKAVTKPGWLLNLPGYTRVVRRQDGKLAAITTGTVGSTSGVVARFSSDNGQTWGEPQLLFPLSEEFGGPEPLVDQKGELQLFFLKERKKTTDDDGSGMPMGIDIWHTHTSGGWKQAPPPVRIWKGYCGSMNCEVQLKSGRILFPFSFYSNCTWSHRGEGTEAYTYRGRGVCTLLYSDDGGDTWTLSPSRLRVSTPDLSTDEGSIEPVLAQLSDGRVWMLLRTQYGRFYESVSQDGAVWTTPKPSRILAGDSPAGLVRLDDGRIVMLWNDCLRFSYAYGGRMVLHAAVSADDGKTWRGFREISRDPRRSEPPPPNGDHGTAYPIPMAANEGMVISTDALPSPRYNLIFDPNWLLETHQQDDFSHGLDDWSAFGVKGVELVPAPGLPLYRKVLQIRKPEAEWPAGAEWNFPAGTSGTLRLRLQIWPGFGGALIGLTDHFSVPYDDLDRFNNLFNCQIEPDGKLPGQGALTPGQWHNLEFRWDGRKRTCRLMLDGQTVATLPQARDTLGINYLRIRSTAPETDPAGLLIESVEAQVSPQG
jgi:hypothetical protein